MVKLYHLTLNNAPADKEVVQKVAALTDYLRAVAHIGGITYYSNPYLENRDNRYCLVYHYRWPDDTMHTTVLPFNSFVVAHTATGIPYINLADGCSDEIVRLPQSR